jgi:hypothetical protein
VPTLPPGYGSQDSKPKFSLEAKVILIFKKNKSTMRYLEKLVTKEIFES